MKFKPVSEEELSRDDLIPKGKYDFEVKFAEDAVSKSSGDDMIKLTLTVFDQHGSKRLVWDYLIETVPWKLRHFCEATGLEKKYESGELTAEDCIGKSGKLEIAIDNKSKDFPPKNVVRDYSVGSLAPKSKSEPDDDDSEIPF
jgi:hypothetical protein